MNKLNFADKLYSDSGPVLILDRNMCVVDSNTEAKNLFKSRISTFSIEKHISMRDRSAMRSLMFEAEYSSSPEANHTIMEVFKVYRYTVALVILRQYFGKYLYEVFFFKSREQLLSFSKTRKTVEISYVPGFERPELREFAEENAEKLKYIFGNNMLSNLWNMALDKADDESTVDIIAVTRCLIVNVLKKTGLLKSSVSFGTVGTDACVNIPGGSDSFILAFVLILYLADNLSGDGKISVSAGKFDDGTGVKLYFKGMKSENTFEGVGVFPMFSLLYPRYEVLFDVVSYICELFGMYCYGTVDKKSNFVIDLYFGDKIREDDFKVMHGDFSEYLAVIDNAVDIISRFEGKE